MVMNAAAATLFWSQFGRPQPDDECNSSRQLAYFGIDSGSLSLRVSLFQDQRSFFAPNVPFLRVKISKRTKSRF
jgi:hypothetical protein